MKTEAQNVEPLEPSIPSTWWSDPDERAVILFKNGNVYEGDISWKCMHGEGRFQWADGTVYIGEFKENAITGRGTLEWRDNSWYTGDFHDSIRHGHGLFVDTQLQRCYFGEWALGTKQGHGVMYHTADFNNCYEGEWRRNLMHGQGKRQYSPNSVYVGEFQHSKREGKGEAIFSNHDIYRGEWKNGIIDGCGYYVWNTRSNDSMSMPEVTTYIGSWVKGERHGYGDLYFGPGLVSRFKGQFQHDQKHGKGRFVTKDGLVVSSKNLFLEGNYNRHNATQSFIAKIPTAKPAHTEKITLLCDDNTQAFQYHIEYAAKKHNEYKRYERLNFINHFIAINTDNVTKFTGGYPEVEKIGVKLGDLLNEERIEFENRCLRLVIYYYEKNINYIYEMYTNVCNSEQIFFPAVLIRLYFWQFCYDCKFQEKGLNLTEIDNLLFKNKRLTLQNSHDPFERLYRWQFVHSLVTLACHFYVGNSFPGHKPSTVVATAFSYFMDTDVLPNVGRRKGNLLKNTFVPVQAVYELYLSLDEPRTVRKFICAAKVSAHKIKNPQPPIQNAKEDQLPLGKNCFLFGDEMVFLEEKTYVFPRKPYEVKSKRLPLFNFGNLSTKCIIDQFVDIIPYLMEDDIIMNIDKEINFYEFFEAFMSCTEISVRKECSYL